MNTGHQADRTRPAGTTIWARMAAGMVVGMIVLAGLWIAAPAGAQETATISVLVVDDNGPVTNVQVDLFASDETGQRLGWMQSLTTGQGSIEFVVEPGCYVTTAVAPQGRVFTDGSQWSNRADCIQPGGFASGVTTLQGTNIARVSGNVRQGATGVADVSIGVFDATADGSRGPWVRDVSTETFGSYNILLAPGCYVLTAVAPADDLFENTGTPWDSQPLCLDDGEERSIDFALTPTSTSRIQVLIVEPNFESVSGAQIDLFTSDFDTTDRLDWVESTVTGSDGLAGFDVLGGCWVLTAIAPEGRTFADSGTQWLDYYDCLPGGGFVLEPVFIKLAED